MPVFPLICDPPKNERHRHLQRVLLGTGANPTPNRKVVLKPFWGGVGSDLDSVGARRKTFVVSGPVVEAFEGRPTAASPVGGATVPHPFLHIVAHIAGRDHQYMPWEPVPPPRFWVDHF